VVVSATSHQDHHPRTRGMPTTWNSQNEKISNSIHRAQLNQQVWFIEVFLLMPAEHGLDF
jgi:hypothetical protein